MHQNLQKVLNLAKKTGDKLIILDSAKPDNIYVVMPFEEYEKMAIGKNEVRGLTEDELLDKINRDIAIWKSEQKIEDNISLKPRQVDNNFHKYDENDYGYEDHEETDDYLEDLEEDDFEEDNYDEPEKTKPQKAKKAKSHWRIPESRKKAAEEIIEEDRQYLEEINY